MITRRELLRALGAGALVAPLISFAQQQAAKIFRIGFLFSSEPPAHLLDVFRNGLRERGYVEGKNIAIEYRWTAGTTERLPDLAAELVRLDVALIFAWATPAASAAHKATATVPIVFVGVSDPVGSGLVASLGRPGGNVTGVSNLARDLSGKLVELLIEGVPGTKRVAVLRNAANPSTSAQLKETEAAARVLGVQHHVLEFRDPKDLGVAFAAMTKARATGAVILPDPVILSQREQVAQLAIKHRMPTVFARRENAEAGGLIAYGPSISDQIRQATGHVDRILKGAKPADLPVEQPTKVELVVNMKTAKALGIKIPQSILVRADKVIE